MTVLGGCGAWPTPEQACSGYLVEHEGFRLLLDPGYAVLPRLLQRMSAADLDAVVVTHGHPDHCADLNPLLRARTLREDPSPALPVYALPGAVDAVLALDRPGMLEDAIALHELVSGDPFDIGPFSVKAWALPHFVPNVGVRLSAAGRTLAYTGDTGPSPDVVQLAQAVDVLLAEATFVEMVPGYATEYLTSAREAGRNASEAGVGQLVLTHLWPGTDPLAAQQAAARTFDGRIAAASPGLVVEL